MGGFLYGQITSAPSRFLLATATCARINKARPWSPIFLSSACCASSCAPLASPAARRFSALRHSPGPSDAITAPTPAKSCWRTEPPTPSLLLFSSRRFPGDRRTPRGCPQDLFRMPRRRHRTCASKCNLVSRRHPLPGRASPHPQAACRRCFVSRSRVPGTP